MKYCMNLLLWTGEVTEGDLPVIGQLKKLGYGDINVGDINGDINGTGLILAK